MPIYQINLYICEICGKKVSEASEVDVYNEPTVLLPNGWNYINVAPLRYELACPLHSILLGILLDDNDNPPST